MALPTPTIPFPQSPVQPTAHQRESSHSDYRNDNLDMAASSGFSLPNTTSSASALQPRTTKPSATRRHLHQAQVESRLLAVHVDAVQQNFSGSELLAALNSTGTKVGHASRRAPAPSAIGIETRLSRQDHRDKPIGGKTIGHDYMRGWCSGSAAPRTPQANLGVPSVEDAPNTLSSLRQAST